LKEYGIEILSQDNRGQPRKDSSKKDVNQDKDLLAEVQRLRMENEYLKKLQALIQQTSE